MKASGRILRRQWSRDETKKAERRYEGMQRALLPAEKPYKNKGWHSGTTTMEGIYGDKLWRGIYGGELWRYGGSTPTRNWLGGLKSLQQWLVVHRVRNGLRKWRVRSQRHHGRGDRFQFRPTGAERWDMSLLEEGWIVRVHSKSRKRRYHPLHSSVPVDARELQGLRGDQTVLGGWAYDHHPGPLDR